MIQIAAIKGVIWPWGVIAALGIAVGIQQVRVSDRDATIAEQKTEMEHREKERAVSIAKENSEALDRYRSTLEAASRSLDESMKRNASASRALDAAVKEARNAKESRGCIDAPGIAPVLDSLRNRQRPAR